MLLKDYKPPMVPPLAHELDLSFFDPTFTAEPPCVSRIQRLPAAFNGGGRNTAYGSTTLGA